MRREARFAVRAGLPAAAIVWTVWLFGGGPAASAQPSCQTLVFQPGNGASLTPGFVGQPYFAQIKVIAGATGAVTFTPSASTPLPPGLKLGPTSNDPAAADVFGTPTQAGVRTFFVDAVDSQGCTGQAAYAINISAGNACNPPLKLSPPGGNLQPVHVDQPIYQSIGVDGGTPPYSGTISGGNAPPGLGIADWRDSPFHTLIVNGTPTATGTFTFQVTVTDAMGCSTTQTFSITIIAPGAPPPSCVTQLNAPIDQQVRVGTAVPMTFTAKNIGGAACTGPFTFDFGPGAPTFTQIPGGAFQLAGTSGPTGQQLGNGGTIPPGGFVGVSTVVTPTTPGSIQFTFDLKAITGPGKTDEVSGDWFLEILNRRDPNRLTPADIAILEAQGIHVRP